MGVFSKMRWSLGAVFGLVQAGRAYGFDLGALAQEDPTGDTFITIAILLLGLTLILGLWSGSVAGVVRRAVRGPRADKLFLHIELQGPDAKKVKAHLRSVDLNTATVVSRDFFEKGAQVRLQLSSLPQFQGTSDEVTAKVLRTEIVRGDPPSYIITFGWGELPARSQQDLTRYIANLSGARGFSPG